MLDNVFDVNPNKNVRKHTGFKLLKYRAEKTNQDANEHNLEGLR